MITIISALVWMLSIYMMVIDFHWGWLVACIITSLLLIAKIGGAGFIDAADELFEGFID